MEILHIITGLNKGGAETVLYNLCRSEKEYDHVVVSLQDAKDLGPLFDQIKVPVHTLNFPKGGVTVSGLIKLYKLILEIKPDAIQTWMYHADFIGGLAARAAGVKNIFWGIHHTKLSKGNSKILTIFISRINALLSHFVPKKIIYCAQESRKVQESIGFKKEKGIVIPNGHDTENFKENDYLRSSFRHEINISNKTFLVGYVGRYDPQKDLKTLLNSFAKLNNKKLNIKFVLVGHNLDTSNSDLVKIINENNLNCCVYLLGKRSDIPSVMNGIDLCVLSSISEAFPNVLNEAMLCSTPCVTTNVGDASIIVGDTGWVVEPQNPDLLANEIINAEEESRTNNSSWVHRKMACRKRIMKYYSIERMLQKYKQAWTNDCN